MIKKKKKKIKANFEEDINHTKKNEEEADMYKMMLSQIRKRIIENINEITKSFNDEKKIK